MNTKTGTNFIKTIHKTCAHTFVRNHQADSAGTCLHRTKCPGLSERMWGNTHTHTQSSLTNTLATPNPSHPFPPGSPACRCRITHRCCCCIFNSTLIAPDRWRIGRMGGGGGLVVRGVEMALHTHRQPKQRSAPQRITNGSTRFFRFCGHVWLDQPATAPFAWDAHTHSSCSRVCVCVCVVWILKALV